MSKNPVSKSKPAKGNEPLRSALRFFVAGCVAELYLLLILVLMIFAHEKMLKKVK